MSMAKGTAGGKGHHHRKVVGAPSLRRNQHTRRQGRCQWWPSTVIFAVIVIPTAVKAKRNQKPVTEQQESKNYFKSMKDKFEK